MNDHRFHVAIVSARQFPGLWIAGPADLEAMSKTGDMIIDGTPTTIGLSSRSASRRAFKKALKAKLQGTTADVEIDVTGFMANVRKGQASAERRVPEVEAALREFFDRFLPGMDGTKG